MAKKQIDKIFADKLQEHEMRPSGKAWERVAQQAGIQTPKKQRPLWLWLIFLSLGGLSWAFWPTEILKEASGIGASEKKAEQENLFKTEVPLVPEASKTSEALPAEAVKAPPKPTKEVRTVRKARQKATLLSKPALEEALKNDIAVEEATATFRRGISPYIQPLPYLHNISAARPKKFRYRIEIVIPYKPQTEPSNEPRTLWRRVLRNVLAD